MKDYIKLSGVLLIICLISSLLLAYVNSVTAPIRQQIIRQREIEARKEVFDLDGEFSEEELVRYNNITILPVKTDNKISGAVITTSVSGFSGDIEIIYGITVDGEIRGIKILSHTETPGLGSRIEEVNIREANRLKEKNSNIIVERPFFTEQFRGLKYSEAVVSEDGGTIDSITAATISSRAVAECIKNSSITFFEWLKEKK